MLSNHIDPVMENVEFKIEIIFLPDRRQLKLVIWVLKRKLMSHWDSSFEYPQHMFWMMNKKINFQLRTLI